MGTAQSTITLSQVSLDSLNEKHLKDWQQKSVSKRGLKNAFPVPQSTHLLDRDCIPERTHLQTES